MLSPQRIFAISILTTLISSNIHAAGFALSEHSASGLGNAFAGAAAIAEDASTTYFNPAGLSKLKGNQVSVAASYISPSSSFTNNGSTLNPSGSLLGIEEGGTNAGLVPALYYSNQLNDKWTFGLGLNAPFASSTEYSDTWVGRYHATKSEITTLNINPSASFKVDEKLSIGFGLNVQYIEATLANKLDSAAICLGATGNSATCLDNTFGMTAVGAATTDSSLSLSGDDWSIGWNFGLLYDISNETRLGMAYRSNIEHALTGTANFTRSTELNNFLTAVSSNAFTDTGISAGVDLPETLSFSVSHELDPKWTMLADVTWTKWKRFDQIVIDFVNPLQATSTIPENWENSMRYSVGANYQADSKWTYRFGVALDESPIPSAVERTPRIPGDDRVWLSLGFGYKTSETLSIDVGYTHIFLGDIPINNADASFGHTLTGNYDISADIVSAQFNWKF